MKNLMLYVIFFTSFFGLPAYAKVIIEKSPSDTREYDYLELSNKLRVVVVSDKSSEKSAATLAVLAGSYDEPVDKPGLAHFLEHMIIMGSKKHPHPGDFNTYVNDHGGGRNAMTAQDRTTFFYDIQPSYFEESLARFSDHFVHPLFDENYIEKEIKAVDAEFQMHREDDFYRGYYILKDMSNPAHAMHRFTAGNKDSLWPTKDKEGAKALRSRFMAFYNEFYSADKMVLVLVGPQSTKVLADLAEKYFKDIPQVSKNENLSNPSEKSKQVKAFREGIETQKNIVMHPLKPFYSLTMAFSIPSQKQNYNTQPLMYLSVLFSNQASGGLIHQLKLKGWILGMVPNQYEISKTEELYALNFSLTETGLSHVDDIIQACYLYIETIKQSKFPDWLYEEVKKSDQINFQHVENTPASSLSNYLAQNLHDYPPEKIVSYAYLDSKAVIPRAAIQALLNKFTPENMVLFSFIPGTKQNKTEPYYQVPYYTEPFSPQQIHFWKQPKGALTQPIALPTPNRFLPADLAIKQVSHYTKPKLIYSTSDQFVWYQPDIEFLMPKIETHLALHNPYIYENPANLLLARLAVGLASEEMAKIGSELMLAGAGVVYDVLETGLVVNISGYSDLVPYQKIVEKSIDTLRNLKIDANRFAIQKEALLKVYQAKVQASPIEHYSEEVRVLFMKRKMPSETMITYLQKLQPNDLEVFLQKFFNQVTVEMLISGNVKKREAKNLAQEVMALINLNAAHKKNQSAELSPILKLPRQGQLLVLTHKHADNLVVMYIQMKDKKVETIAKSYLTDYLIKTKFFDALRTESQFGYIVSSQSFVMRDLPGLIFLIQSPKNEHAMIYKRMGEFFQEYDKTLTNMKPVDFEQVKKSLIADILEKPQNLSEKSQRFWTEIVDRTYRFDRSKALAKAVNKISQKELLSFYQEAMLNTNRKELTVFGASDKTDMAPAILAEKNLINISDTNLFKEKSEYIR
jgi:secreted Zn-dependent insulinase-like peptidase